MRARFYACAVQHEFASPVPFVLCITCTAMRPNCVAIAHTCVGLVTESKGHSYTGDLLPGLVLCLPRSGARDLSAQPARTSVPGMCSHFRACGEVAQGTQGPRRPQYGDHVRGQQVRPPPSARRAAGRSSSAVACPSALCLCTHPCQLSKQADTCLAHPAAPT